MEKNRYHKILSGIREHTSLFAAFRDGMTPSEVKEDIINSFSPYFENQEAHEENAVQLLVPEIIEFARVSTDKWALDVFEFALRVHKSAKRRNAKICLTSYADWMPAKSEGLSKYWSQIHLEIEKSELGLEEFAHECLRNIGGFIEGSIKPYSMELLHQVRIFKGMSTTKKEIDRLDLGNVIDELIKFSSPLVLFSIEDVRLNTS